MNFLENKFYSQGKKREFYKACSKNGVGRKTFRLGYFMASIPWYPMQYIKRYHALSIK